jgi:hypothetical protein
MANTERTATEVRPLSTWAQICQATLTFFLLASAIAGYVLTVLPVYEYKLTEENRARLELEINAKTVNLGKLQHYIMDAQDKLAAYRSNLLPEVIEKITISMLIDGESLLHASSGGDSSTVYDREIDQIYYDHISNGINYQVSHSHTYGDGTITGLTIIDSNLSHPVLNLLDSFERKRFVERMNSVVNGNVSYFSQALTFRNPIIQQIPYTELQPDQKAQIDAEKKRQEAAHVAFIEGLDRIKMLLQAADIPPLN